MVVGVWKGYKSNESIILCILTKNNATAIIISLFVSFMKYSSYCWIFVSCIRYFEFYDLIVSSVVMCVLS